MTRHQIPFCFLLLMLYWPTHTLAEDVKQANDTAHKQASSLEEIIVRGNAGDKTKIDVETQQLLQVPGGNIDPMAALLSLPGVTFGSDFDRAPAVRGSAPGDNQFLIDNIPVSYIFHIYGNSIFNANLIHKFNLYPANFASRYNNASGAIIDVQLRDPAPKPFGLMLDWSLLYTGVLFEGKLSERQAAFFSYRRSLVDKFYSEEDASDSDKGIQLDNIPVSSDYQYKHHWNLGQHQWHLLAAGARDFIRATFLQNSTAAQRDPDLLGPARIKNGFDSQALIWQFDSLKNYQSETSLAHSTNEQALSYGTNQRMNIKTNNMLLQNRMTQQLSADHTLEYGIRIQQQNHEIDLSAKVLPCSINDPECDTLNAPRITLIDDLSVRRLNAFTESRWQLNQGFQLQLGLQANTDDYLKDTSLEPRFKFIYGHEQQEFSFALGQYNQLPELGTILPKVGNPKLRYIKTQHVSLGHEIMLNSSWSVKTETYYKLIENEPLSLNASRDADFTNNYSNDLSGRAYGLELLLSKANTGKFNGWLAISLSKSERHNDRTGEWFRFDYDRPININWVGTYHFNPAWSFGFKWQIQSGLVDTPIVDIKPNIGGILSPVYGPVNSQRLPLYHRLDLKLQYQWQRKKDKQGMIFFDLINAYNQRNVEAYVFNPGGTDLITPPKGYGQNVPISEERSIGLFPSIGVRFEF